MNLESFWEHIDKQEDGCWLWTGRTDTDGYGRLTWQGSDMAGAHRVMWELTYGPIPEGLFVCHDCPGGDNPACVNPEHLFLGTCKDNVHDAIAKGRMFNAEAKAKLLATHLGKPLSEETREKISVSLLGNTRSRGHKATKEFCEMISARNKGNTYGKALKGVPKSEAHRQHIKEAWARRRAEEGGELKISLAAKARWVKRRANKAAEEQEN